MKTGDAAEPHVRDVSTTRSDGVRAEPEGRKTVADSAGAETELPVSERVEIGIFAAAGPGEVSGRPPYVRKHRVRSGTRTITLMLPDRPARGGIDPYNLLDREEGDNIEEVEIRA